MPYPRSRSYATPEETFGITQKPLNAWFDAAASGMTRTGPAFSASFEDATLRNQQREVDQERLRRQLESEQAAGAFLKLAAGEKPDALMQMIAEDPAILGSKDAPMIRDYVAMQQELQKQRQIDQPYSNKVLGPALMKQLEPEDQATFASFMEQGMEATEAVQKTRELSASRKSQLELSKLEQKAAEAGVGIDKIRAARIDPNPSLALSAAIGEIAVKGKAGAGGDGELSPTQLISVIESFKNEFGEIDPEDKPAYDAARERLRALIVGNKPLPITNAPAAGAVKAPPVGGVTQAPPVIPPAPPASDVEAARLKTQQQRDIQESQKQQLADAAWTGVKGTAAARGTQDDPTAIMSEAKAAIVGGTAKNPRAQRIAALARAFADGRQVETTQEFTENFEEGGRPVNMPVRKSPEEVLVAELGYEPDAIVGQAPTKAGGAMRNITALEAARAILAEAADPFVKLKGAAESTPTITRDTARSLIQEVDAAK